ncbi:HS12A-like protein, partial [Mya arenaria]
MSPFSTGQHYMVVNAGGVTVDINVIELVGEGQLKVLNMNSGGPWGESRVDEAFQDFVRKLVGNLVFDEFKKTCVEDFDQLQRQSETKKRRDTKGKETINIPVALIEIYNSKTKKTMDEAVKQFKGHLSWTAGKLRVNCEFVRGWFKDTCDNIVKSVRDLFRQHGMFSCKTILLVGGFAESSVLQQAFRDNFPDKRLIVPEEAGLAVLKGAVLFGHLKPYLSTVHCSSDCYSEDKEKSTKPVQTIIVAAIDFGSAFSGYAFAVRDDLKIDSENPKISTGTGFVSGQMISHKTPTVLLLNPDKSFAAFGYAAEEKYSTLFEDDREQKTSSHRSYYYFRRLKMRLYSPDRPMTLSRDVEIQDEHGKRMKAIDVFSICIKHLATEFMKLGRNSQVEASATVSQFQEGTKYMVVDAGGGTIDVIVHEIVGDNKLKELTSASGGPWGGTLVDKEFDAFMETIFVCAGTNTILLVGGYAESPMLQSEIKDAFRDKTVIIPDEAGLAVLKGAVLFGNDPLVVVSRIARCSYGICVFRDFDPRIHAQEKKTVIEGKLKCKDIFAKHVQRGDELTVGQAQLHQRYSKLEADQISFVLDIYTSTNADPRFVDDEDCTYLGCLEIEVPPEDSKDNGIKVNMTFGGTELEVEARDEKYGKTKKATFDFLVDNLNPQSKIA